MARKITGIDRAVRYYRTQTGLGEAIGVVQSRIAVWVKQRYVPEHRVKLVYDACRGTIPMDDLRRPPKRKQIRERESGETRNRGLF